MDENVILKVLSEQKEEIENYSPQDWVTRHEESQFEFDSPLAQVVIGVRRSGKSTMCHKVLLEKGVKYGYVNLDDDRLAKLKTEDLDTLLSCIYQLYGTDVPYLFLDEIQNVDGWHLFVNRLLRNKLHVFVTGSNAKLLSSELATHLTGRYNEIRLYPFSFAEYCDFHNIDTKKITTKAEAERKTAFMNYITNGGFPEMQNLQNKRAYVQGLIEAIIQKDIKNRFGIRNGVNVLSKTANHLINNACQEVNFQELAKILDVGDKTIRNYVDYLQRAFFVSLLTKHSFKSKERLRGCKAYVIDTGLQNNRENSFAAENVGWRLENVVYIELLRRAASDFLDIYYYKPSARAKEVDFVVCNQDKPQELIQVAYDISETKTLNRETSALIAASKKLGCSKLTLIAFSPTRTIEINGYKINIISALEWLLNKQKHK